MDLLNYFNDWKCRSSSLARIAVSLDRLTDNQRAELSELETRKADAIIGKAKPLTEIMEGKLSDLRKKEDNTDLPQGVKTYLREEWIRIIHRRERQIESKYLKKGTSMEETALDLVSEIEGRFHKKNTEELSNDWIKGTPDSITWGVDWIIPEVKKKADALDDTKCAWDIFTYYAQVDNSDNDGKDDYYWQIQGYCSITGATFGRVRRCLLDTPDNLLEADKLRLKLKLGVIDMDGPGDDAEAYRQGAAEIDRAGRYDDIPKAARLHTTVILRDDEVLAKLYRRVEECRVYLNKIQQDYLLKLTVSEIQDLYIRLSA